MLPPDGWRLEARLYSPESNKTRAPRLKLTAARNHAGVNSPGGSRCNTLHLTNIFMIFCSRAQPLLEVTHERNNGGIIHPAGTCVRRRPRDFATGVLHPGHIITTAFLRRSMKLCWALLPKAATSNRVIRGRFPYALRASAQSGLVGEG